jgi:hypothetical protein
MKATLIPLIALLAGAAPLAAHAQLLGDWQGTFVQTLGQPNSGSINLDFLTSTPNAGIFAITGTVGLVGTACMNNNCGFNPTFSGTFNQTTDTVSLLLVPASGSGDSPTEVVGTLSYDIISGTSTSASGVADFSVHRAPEINAQGAGAALTLLVGMLATSRGRRVTVESGRRI